jgi:hypothetical protein
MPNPSFGRMVSNQDKGTHDLPQSYRLAADSIPPYPPLPAKREQAKIQEDGQSNAKYDADDYPEQAPSPQLSPLWYRRCKRARA